MKNNNEETFFCVSCEAEFNSKYKLRKHLLFHQSEFTCDICNKTYKFYNNLRQHKNKEHKHAKRQKKIYPCDVCNKVLTSETGFKMHQSKHEGTYKVQCVFCDAKFFKNATYRLHLGSKHGQSDFICDICGRHCYSKLSLSNHRLTHDDAYKNRPKVQCSTCEKWFVSERNLQLHITTRHENVGKCICEICGKVLNNKKAMETHTVIHLGLKPHVCNYCGRGFADKNTLVCHIRTHTGEKPYCCKTCGRRFAQPGAFKIHTRMHSGEKPYACDICKDTFVSSSVLNAHVKSKHRVMHFEPKYE